METKSKLKKAYKRLSLKSKMVFSIVMAAAVISALSIWISFAAYKNDMNDRCISTKQSASEMMLTVTKPNNLQGYLKALGAVVAPEEELSDFCEVYLWARNA